MTEHQRQYDHYAEVKRRLMANAYRPAPQLPANENKRVRVIMRLPDPIAMDIDPDDITRTAYARKRAVELGYSLNLMKTGGRMAKLVLAKHRIMHEIKCRWPETSYPFLARLMAMKDHTSALHAVKRIQKLKDEGKL